jgi:hypothetical protein
MAQQPWRDVCSAILWANTMKKHKRGGSLNIFIDAVTAELRTYHLLEKADMSFFRLRRGSLRTIEGKVKLFLAHKDGLKAPADLRRHSELLQHQAKLKAGYLDKIQAFYLPEGAGYQYLDPVAFINFLKSPHVAPENGARLQPGTRMEALDPAHRSFEMHFKNNVLQQNNFYSAMESVFGEWIGAVKYNPDVGAQFVNPNALNNDSNSHPALNTPFFVWMENHFFCVGQDHEGYEGIVDPLKPKDLQSIIYSPYSSGKQEAPIEAVDEIHWLMPSSDGLVMEFPLAGNNSGKLRIFDTQHLTGKPPNQNDMNSVGEPKSAAYVWTKDGTLLAGEHKPNHLHHSSFVGGGDIRCAGMINVKYGKVEFISNNSGHYRPSAENLKEFAKWLNGRNVFHAQSRAILNGGEESPLISKFLEGNVRGKNRPSNPNVVDDLKKLETSRISVVQKYEASRTKGGLFNHNSIFRSKSEESQKVLNYLKKEFKEDIETAKLDTSDPSWYGFPTEVIRTLLGEPKSLPFSELLKQVSGRTVIGNKKFSSLAGLTPLKKSSAMHSILSEEFNKL